MTANRQRQTDDDDYGDNDDDAHDHDNDDDDGDGNNDDGDHNGVGGGEASMVNVNQKSNVSEKIKNLEDVSGLSKEENYVHVGAIYEETLVN